MTRPIHSFVRSVVALAAFAIATPVFAGPPLLCHPCEIGTARSLPWDRLTARAEASEAGGHPDGLAFLDAAYVAEAFREIASLGGSEFARRAPGLRAAIGQVDAYALISRSISARPDDPAIQFAAALIAADKDRGRYTDHAAKARAGAAADTLLARNLKLVQ